MSVRLQDVQSISTFATCLKYMVKQPRDCKMAVNRTGYKLHMAALLTDIIQDLKSIKNVKGCRGGMPKSMQTR